MKKLFLMLSVVAFAVMLGCGCNTTYPVTESPTKKNVEGAYAEVAVPPEEVKIQWQEGDQSKTFWFFLGRKTNHSSIYPSTSNNDEWYLIVSEDATTQTKLKGMNENQTAIFAVALIPPLTEFYDAIREKIPEPLKSRVTALNLYKIYRSFGAQVVAKEQRGSQGVQQLPNSYQQPYQQQQQNTTTKRAFE